MKNLKYLYLGFMCIFVISCKTEIVEAIDEFSFENGGYMRTVTPYPLNNSTFKVSIANLSGTKLEQVLEAVTKDKGSVFSSYDLTIKFEDKSAANGNNSTTEKAFKSLAASSFVADPTTGYPRSTMVVSGADALAATGLTADKLTKGDYFTINATMILSDGKKFNAANTGVNITGGAFYSSPFTYRINVIE